MAGWAAATSRSASGRWCSTATARGPPPPTRGGGGVLPRGVWGAWGWTPGRNPGWTPDHRRGPERGEVGAPPSPCHPFTLGRPPGGSGPPPILSSYPRPVDRRGRGNGGLWEQRGGGRVGPGGPKGCGRGLVARLDPGDPVGGCFVSLQGLTSKDPLRLAHGNPTWYPTPTCLGDNFAVKKVGGRVGGSRCYPSYPPPQSPFGAFRTMS